MCDRLLRRASRWRILREERIAGLPPLSALEAVGRGASKTSEIAARPGTAQTNLGRTIASAIQPCVFGCGFTPRKETTGTASRLKKKQVTEKRQGSHLGHKHPDAEIEILDASVLAAGLPERAEGL